MTNPVTTFVAALTPEKILLLLGLAALLVWSAGNWAAIFAARDGRLDEPSWSERIQWGMAGLVVFILFIVLLTIIPWVAAAPIDCPIGMPPAECGNDIIELSRVYLPGLWR